MMKKIKSDITYAVPSSAFCNKAVSALSGKASKELCRFCIKKNGAYSCVLHNEPLNYDGTFVEKTEGCRMATAGVAIEILDPAPQQVDPKKIMRMTIDEYNKQIKSLVDQGYPYAMAQKLAKQLLLGG